VILSPRERGRRADASASGQGRKISINIWGWNTLQEKINQHEPAKQAFDTGFSLALASQMQRIIEHPNGRSLSPAWLVADAGVLSNRSREWRR